MFWFPVNVPQKRLRFKTTTDASEVQVIEAMKKIASHIKTSSKVGKASKLAIQLITAGSIKPATSDYFFAILESAMWSQTVCNDPSVRADYHALFSATQDVTEVSSSILIEHVHYLCCAVGKVGFESHVSLLFAISALIRSREIK